jgi:hypothetical protein
MAGGMPSPGYGPGRPLPGGRDGRGDGEREARRMAARLGAAQRRLGGIEMIPSSHGDEIIVDLPVIPAPRSTSRLSETFRRIVALRHPRRRA